MRKCPTCQRTYTEDLRFCQNDGTPLVEMQQEKFDPYKTVVVTPTDVPPSPKPEEEFDPMKTVLAPPPKISDPTPFGQPSDPSLSPPSFGSTSPPSFGGVQPESPQFGTPQTSAFNEPRQTFNEPRQPSFQDPTPSYGQSPFDQPQQPWSPPPAPVQEWGNQGLGQNTPFSPPPPRAGGQDQTLGIVSLISGVVGLLCCAWLGIILGPVALITGFMQMNKVKQDPTRFGGNGLAIAGMIVGGLAALGCILYWLLIILGVALGPR